MTVSETATAATADDAPEDRRSGAFSTAIGRLYRDPRLFVPFLVVGVLLSVVDRLRRADPIPVIERAGIESGEITVAFVGYPTGLSRTIRPLEALVGLEFPYLIWGAGLHVLALGAISVAGLLTIGRAMGVDPELGAGVRVFAYVFALDFFSRALGSIDALQAMGLLGFVPLAFLLYLYVRLFAVPGFLVAGRSFRSAVYRSGRRTKGHGLALFGLVLTFGLGSWLLAEVPHVGTVLNTAAIAPVHAASIAAFLDLYSPESAAEDRAGSAAGDRPEPAPED